MMKNSNFGAFILTHGRPNNVVTYKTLKKSGYSGKIFIVIDNEDDTSEGYYKNFGDSVIMFDKQKISETFDEADNFGDRRAIVYARNACFNIAKDLGLTHFIQLDDDYTVFNFRITDKGAIPSGRNFAIRTTLDDIFDALVDFHKSTNIASIALAQGGDFIGGKDNDSYQYKLKRKCMNTFICSTERPFQFVGRINEDVNTYTSVASRGKLFFTTPLASITQKATQSNEGGMTDIYLDNGTYIKSFYTVIFSPSSCKVALMGDKARRLHHQISWNNAVPKILDESYKKL